MNKYFTLRRFCPCCKSTNSTTLRKVAYTESPIKDHLESFYSPIGGVEFEYLEGADYILKECNECGLIYQKEIPNEFLMYKLYDCWIDSEKVMKRLQSREGVRHFLWVASEIANVIKYLDIEPHKLNFLDFGMGRGNWCMIAKGMGCDVAGFELSQVWIDNAKKAGIKVVSWEDIPRQQYDFINAEQVFEHIPNAIETLVHLSRSLKPNGIIRISTPSGWDIKKRLKIWNWEAIRDSKDCLLSVAPLQHINCYNYDVLVKMGQKVDLEAVEIPKQFTITEKKIKNLKNRVKVIIRPFYNSLKRRADDPKKGSKVFFRNPIL